MERKRIANIIFASKSIFCGESTLKCTITNNFNEIKFPKSKKKNTKHLTVQWIFAKISNNYMENPQKKYRIIFSDAFLNFSITGNHAS